MAKKVTKVVTTTTTTTEEIVDKKIVETHYLLILDKSGSMSSVRSSTIKSFNEQIQTIKSLNKKFPDQKYFMSLISFNNSVDEIFMNIPADDLKEISEKDYIPEGSTALLDAMGQGITRLEDKIAPRMNDVEKEVTAVVVIMTDGEENASIEWKAEGKIKTLIDRLNKDNRWTISYIGANQNAILNSSNYGIYSTNTVNYAATARGTSAVADALSNTMYMRASTINASSSYSDASNLSQSFFSDYNGNIEEKLSTSNGHSSIPLPADNDNKDQKQDNQDKKDN